MNKLCLTTSVLGLAALLGSGCGSKFPEITDTASYRGHRTTSRPNLVVYVSPSIADSDTLLDPFLRFGKVELPYVGTKDLWELSADGRDSVLVYALDRQGNVKRDSTGRPCVKEIRQ